MAIKSRPTSSKKWGLKKKLVQQNLADQNQVLDCLQNIKQYQNFEEMLTDSVRKLVTEIKSTGAYILQVDPYDPGQLYSSFAYSWDNNFDFPTHIYISNSLSGQVAQNGQLMIIKGTPEQDVARAEFGEGTKHALSVPITNFNQTAFEDSGLIAHAVLTIVRTEDNPFTELEVSLAQQYAGILSLILAGNSTDQFKNSVLVNGLTQLSQYIENLTPHQRGHSERTAEIAKFIATKAGLSPENIQHIHTAACLMDIGTVALPAELKQPKDQLNELQQHQAQMHPMMSHEICSNFQLPSTIQFLVKHHHERMDGTGFPDRMSGSDLTLSLRILTLAEAYDDIRSSQPNGEMLNDKEALAMLSKDAGTKFDPMLFQLLSECVDEDILSYLYFGLQAS